MTRGELLDEIAKNQGEEIYGRDAIDEILELEKHRIIEIIDWIDGDIQNDNWINRKELKREIDKK